MKPLSYIRSIQYLGNRISLQNAVDCALLRKGITNHIQHRHYRTKSRCLVSRQRSITDADYPRANTDSPKSALVQILMTV